MTSEGATTQAAAGRRITLPPILAGSSRLTRLDVLWLGFRCGASAAWTARVAERPEVNRENQQSRFLASHLCISVIAEFERASERSRVIAADFELDEPGRTLALAMSACVLSTCS